MSFLTNGENIALVVVVRTYEHFLFPCTQRGPPLFSLAGRSRLSSIWFSYMHTAEPDRHYIGCNNQLSFIWIWAFVIHGGFWVGAGRLTMLVCADVHFFSRLKWALWGRSERGEGSNQGGGSLRICLGNAQTDDALLTLGLPSLANKMPSALLIVLGPAFTVKNSQYLINDA